MDTTTDSAATERPVVTIRRSGNLIDISNNGTDSLQPAVRQLLEPQLRYEKLKFNYGAALWDPATNLRSNRVEVQDKFCYRYDAMGRLITNFGFVYRIAGLLQSNGYNIKMVESVRELARPDCYVPNLDNVEKHFSYRERQEECLAQIITKPCGIIHAVTGFGKLVMITMACLAFDQAKIAIVTRRAPLVNKIAAFLTKYIPNVGQVGGNSISKNKGPQYGDRITVYTCASLHKADFDVDFLLVDEVHEAIADDAAKHLARFRYSRNFGFSATPAGRLDGTDIRAEALFGKTIFYLPYPEAVALGLVVPIRVEWDDVFIATNPCAGLDDIEKLRAGIWLNSERNQIIAKGARTFDDDDQVQILTETIEHAVALRQFIPEYTLVYDQLEMKRFEWYKKQNMLPADEPKMTPYRKEMLRVGFERGLLKKVISTKMWAVGIDPVQLTALFRAEGRDSKIMDTQAPGRVSRLHSTGTKQVGIVRDFRDQFDAGLVQRARRRFANYAKLGWEQVLVKPDGSMTPMG